MKVSSSAHLLITRRRFLDAQRITCLTAYLELLHEQGLASVDHTTLLLNCYTKLKDERTESGFITTHFTRVQVRTPDERGRRNPEEANRLSSKTLLALLVQKYRLS